MVQKNRCSQCSAELPEDAPRGLCSKCRLAPELRGTTIAVIDTATSAPVSAQSPIPVSAALSAATERGSDHDLGPVSLIAEVGRGAMGVVYRGHDKVLGRDVAVKFMAMDCDRDDPSVARFLEEARCAAALRHPNLTQIYNADIAADTPYLVMEFINGPNLRQLLLDGGPMPVNLAVAVLAEISAAVAELHDRGIIHRDLKPGNVLIDSAGQVYVTDFGLALNRPVRAGQSSADPAGSPAYMAPEAFDGVISTRIDIYALGIMAYELLTATLPYTGTLEEVKAAHQSSTLPKEALERAGVPVAVVDVIERATHKQPRFRYKTAQDFIRALSDAVPTGSARSVVKTELVAWINRARGPARASGAQTPAGESMSFAQTLSKLAAWKREQRSLSTSAPETHAAALVWPPILSQPAASPAEGDWLHEPGIPFWKPGWSDRARYMGWRWLLVLPGMAMLFVMIGLLFSHPFGLFQFSIFGWKFLVLALVLPLSSAAAFAMRSAMQARRDPFCIHCGYTLTGLPDHHRCPECGRQYSFQLIEEYRRDPDWFIHRCQAHRELPDAGESFAAGKVRSKRKSRDGT